MMKETWLLIFALALFLLRPFWLWQFWRAPLKQGEGWFLGIEVEPEFRLNACAPAGRDWKRSLI
jgi:hypothetical protein